MNKVWKMLLPLVLVVALLTTVMPAFAAESPTTKAIGKVKVSSTTYNGKEQNPVVKVFDADGKKVPSDYYEVKVNGTPKDAGYYTVTVTGKAPYTGTKTANFHIWKAKNPFTIEAEKTTFIRNRKKRQTASISVSGVEEGAKLFNWRTTQPGKVFVSGGEIIVRRGFSGIAVLSIYAQSTKNYRPTKKTITVTVKRK